MTVKHLIILITVLFAFSLFSPPASASDFRTEQILVIAKDQVINDDLYLIGGSITVDGIINGDLVAVGGEIRVSGTVNGSLMAVGGIITVSGNIVDDIRAAGGTITIDGNVGDNALIFGENFNLGKSARVNRDLTIGTDNAIIDGAVNGSINGGASNIEMKGTTAGNVTVNIENSLKILPDVKIGGNLEYTAPRPAEISGIVSGKTTYRGAPGRERGIVSALTGKILGYLWLLLMGIVFLIIAPRTIQNISDNISIRPLKNLLWGLLYLIVTPIFAVILLITVIGIPLGLTLIAIYIITVYASRIFIGLWIGQYILGKFKKEIRHKALLPLAIGLLIIVIGINLPILGIFVHFVIIVFGLGTIALTGYDYYHKFKREKIHLKG